MVADRPYAIYEPMEVALQNLEEFVTFVLSRPQSLNFAHVTAMASSIKDRGYIDTRRFGRVPVDVLNANYRESIVAMGMLGRGFALLDLLDEAVAPIPSARILSLEGLTIFADVLNRLYPNAICSEYAPDAETQARIAPVPHVDAQNMQFDDAVFDAVVSADIFEHLPNLAAAIAECRRVLRPGGVLISTFPFAAAQIDTVYKAKIEGGELRHLVEPPEYHGDPVQPDKGVLVFQIPGWDILDLCRSNGFSRAEMIYTSDINRGFIAADMDGLFMLRATA